MGTLRNTVTVTGDDGLQTTIIVSDSASVAVTARIVAADLQKSANVAQASAGDTITYTYHLTNTSNVPLNFTAASDDRLGAVNDLAGQLAPDAMNTATLTYTVQAADPLGPLVNTVTVTGTDGGAFFLIISDSTTVNIVEPDALGLTVTKSVNVIQAEVGDIITYTYQITNTGNVTLTTITASDDQLGDVDGLADELAPDGTSTATLTYTVQPGDAGTLVNTVVVTGTDALGASVVADATFSIAVSNPTNLPEQPQQPGMEIFLPRVEH